MGIQESAQAVLKKTASAAANAGRRGRREVELRRIRSQIQREEIRIGRLLYPLIAEGSVSVESPEVTEAVARLRELDARLEATLTART